MKTLCLLVTCCVEQTRFDILKQVVSNLKQQQLDKNFYIENDLIVFDNGSNFPGAVDLIKNNFQNIYASTKNEGFWSAINWVLTFTDVSRYEYIYIIESDHIHFALEKLHDVESFLNTHPDVGGVRAQEFVVSERHLYDKYNQRSDSRSYAWVSQRHHKTGERISIVPSDTASFYVTNFLSQLHSINRIEPFKRVFQQLEMTSRSGSKFSELDYQRSYAELYPLFGLIDGGLFHAKLSWIDTGAMAGSYCSPENAAGYQITRTSIITPPEKMNVVKL